MERETMEEGLLKKPIIRNVEEDEFSGASFLTPLLVFTAIVSISVSFSMGSAIGFSSAAEAGIIEDLGLSTAQYSFFGSVMTFGSLFGAIPSGKLADLMGRKRAMLLQDIFLIIGWLAIIFAKDAWWLYLGRLSLGFGGGLMTYLAAIYIAEIAPKNIRGGFAAVTQLVYSLGVSLMFFIGNVIAWRTLAVIGALPCLAHVLGLIFIPESPRWLAKVGREKQLEETLQRLRGVNTDVTQETTEIRDSIKSYNQLSESRFLEMFEKRYARALIVVIGVLVIIPFGGSMGILFYASSIFREAGSSVSFGTTAVAIIQIPVCILSILLMDKSGRRPVLMVSLSGACIGSFLAGLAFLLQDFNQWKELTSTLVLIGIVVHLSSFAMGLMVPWVIMAEILPLNIKGSAGSLTIFINTICSWIVNFAFSFLLQWSPSGMFFIFAIFSGLGILFVAKLVPETKGRTLEEIEASILMY